MYYSKLFSVLVALAVPSWVVADTFGPCTDDPGVVNGQCVKLFDIADPTCQVQNQIDEFKPNVCDNACINVLANDGSILPFQAISVVGDGTFGTDCKVFSDQNCATEIFDTGNNVPAPAICRDFPVAQSMQCFFKC